jgi:hypothetical protein
MKFWFPWTISALVAATFVVFFLIGLGDGTVSAFNILLWVGILAVVGGCVGGSLWLRKNAQPVASIVLAWVLAVPGLFALLFLLLVLILQPRWN